MPEATEQVPDTEAPEQVAAPAAKGSGGKMIVKIAIFSAIALVAVVAAYFVTLNVVKPMLAPSAETVATEVVEEAVANEAESSGGHGGGHGEAVADAGESDFFTIESIVVNPAGTAGTRFLSCSVSFQMADDKAHSTFERAEVQIKDLLITILSSKSVDELSDITSRNKMRREILNAANQMITPAAAKAVYLTDFVLQ
jgi:flagellar FliL protein